MNSISVKYRSYENEYTKEELDRMVLKKKSHTKAKPECPLCHTKIYVKSHYPGLRNQEYYELREGMPEKPDEIGAPLTCIYEGFDWDCARCMIIFEDEIEFES